MPPENEGKPEGGEQAGALQARRPLNWPAFVVAVAVVIAWLVLLRFMSVTAVTDISNAQWARLVTVLGSMDSVAFAAFGALLGVTVQRQRVVDANTRAEQERRRADGAEKRAYEASTKADHHLRACANGQALSVAVQNHVALTARLADAGGAGVAAASSAIVAADDELAALAARLFPD
jgi:hypothetical protein